jgi:hypothetical protein
MEAPEKKRDIIWEIMEKAMPYITVHCFVYKVLKTILRSVLYLNGDLTFGQNIWHGDKDTEDVLRFIIVFWATVGGPAVEMLRGGPIAKGVKKYLPNGHYDLMRRALTCIPSARQLRNYAATPFLLKDVVRVSASIVDAALKMRGGPKGLVLGVTFDCVHGESHLEVVRDIDGEFILLGAASPDGLKGAARNFFIWVPPPCNTQ